MCHDPFVVSLSNHERTCDTISDGGILAYFYKLGIEKIGLKQASQKGTGLSGFFLRIDLDAVSSVVFGPVKGLVGVTHEVFPPSRLMVVL